MDIIRNVEIRYFRSIYRAGVRDLRAVSNVFSGRNDAGKSNVLKALNLFFNGQTDWNKALRFYDDFSNSRLQEVRKESVKGKQFISIEVEFNRPDSYAKSLPETFRVKRQWLRESKNYDETNNLDATPQKKKLPGNLHTARRFLARFLNTIHFEYVPAIKDRTYFDSLLSRLQSTLLRTATNADTTLAEVATNLARHIQEKIGGLEADFERATGLKSSVEPPAEFGALFQAFSVSTGSDVAAKIPLVLHGDGIQARYVSSVLHYIAQSSNDFFLWGYEEPENSLEYLQVLGLARDLMERYSEKAQIFVTSHSPAFAALRTQTNTCYRVYQANGNSELAQVWPKDADLAQNASLMEELGMMRIQEGLHEEFKREVEQRRTVQVLNEKLVADAREAQKPLLLVEGVTDRKILEVAWTKLRGNDEQPIVIRVADPTGGATPGGSGGADSLGMVIESIMPADGRRAIAVFDRDAKGAAKFVGLSKNFRPWSGHEDVKVHVNGVSFALLLPIPAGRESHANKGNLCIEFLFPDPVLERRTKSGKGLELIAPHVQEVIINGKRIKLTAQAAGTLDIEELGRGLLTIGDDGKVPFAFEIVPALEPEAFAAFEPLFKVVQQLLA